MSSGSHGCTASEGEKERDVRWVKGEQKREEERDFLTLKSNPASQYEK